MTKDKTNDFIKVKNIKDYLKQNKKDYSESFIIDLKLKIKTLCDELNDLITIDSQINKPKV